MRKAPIFSRDASVSAILLYDDIGLSCLAVLSIITATLSGLGFVAGFDDPTPSTYLIGVAFGFGVWVIARGFWHGAWLLPEIIHKNLLAIYCVTAFLGFGTYGAVSYIGNQKVVAGGVSQDLAEEDRIDGLTNDSQDLIAFLGGLAAIASELAEREDQAMRTADAEAGGGGPSGARGEGPVYFSLIASAGAFKSAKELIEDGAMRADAVGQDLATMLAAMRDLRADPELGRGERRARLKTAEGEILAAMRRGLAVNPHGLIEAAAQLIAVGVQVPSNARGASITRIAEISADMAAYAEVLKAKAERLAVEEPELPEQSSQSQEEHLIANALRMPGLSLAAALFDACGWIIILFRYAAYRSLRARDEEENEKQYDAFVTVRDFKRIEDMTLRARMAQTRLLEAPEDAPRPPGRPRGSKNRTPVKGGVTGKSAAPETGEDGGWDHE